MLHWLWNGHLKTIWMVFKRFFGGMWIGRKWDIYSCNFVFRCNIWQQLDITVPIRESTSMRSLTTYYTALLKKIVFISYSVFYTCPCSSPLLSIFFLSTTSPCPWSVGRRATHGAVCLIHTALRGDVMLHHKLNKTRKTFSVYSSWVQGQTTVKWW